MIHGPDGKLRFSPRDLVSYLEGDFAAWCDRMQAERGRNGGASSSRELAWATPDEDEEASLAARKGREHEERYLARVRAEHAGLVEITFGDPAAPGLTLAAMTAGAPAIYQAQLVSDGWHGYADFLFRCAGRLRLRRPTTTRPGTPSSPAPPSRTSWCSSAPTPTCSKPCAATGRPSWCS